jgi:hypothetical protein
MTARANPLRVVEKEPALDITALNRADIAKRDWARVMIEGDRRKAIYLPERVRRIWR